METVKHMMSSAECAEQYQGKQVAEWQREC